MTAKKPSTSRRTFVKGTAASAAIAPFFIGRSAKAAYEAKTVKMMSVAPANTPWSALALKFKKHLEKSSEGQLKAKFYGGGVSGSELETLKACADGRVECWAGSMGAAASIASAVGATELPYLFKNPKAAYKSMTANRQLFHDIFWDAGFKLVMFAENGVREIGTTGFEVNTPADLKGRKIRVQESKIHADFFNAAGASTVQMGITEVLSSLQTKVVEGMDNTKLYAQAMGAFGTLTHWSETQHIYQPAVILFSRKGFWDNLPTELQEAIALDSKDVLKMENRGMRSIWALNGQLKQNLLDMNITVTEPDLGPWQKLAGGVHKKFEKRATKQGVALLKALR